MLQQVLAAIVLASVFSACASTRPPESPVRSDTVGPVPLFEGLGTNSRKITTASKDAQRYFDQGLSFLFAFNHDEAIRSFRKAAEYDPQAAMPWWGISVANGPHINNPVVAPESASAAWEALQKAKREPRGADAVEAALVDALSVRYADPAPADRAALDLAYADAMRKVWQRYPEDADIGALFAESLMDLRPWNQWTPEGKAQPGTEEVIATLDRVLELRPDHPLALHLYIHAVEASPEPGRAEKAANGLRDLQPGLGHLVHMPSHIDVRLGHWQKAVTANAKAIRADARYRAVSPRQGFYGLYMAHNHHMLAFAAMMIGHRAEATQAIDTVTAAIPPDWARQYAPIADGYLAMPLEVRVRFGAWDEVLAAPEPDPIFPLARAMRHYARGVAFLATGDTRSARAEQALFATARAALPAESFLGNNKGSDLLTVADRVLEGEISYREGNREAAFAALKQAVHHEEGLKYDEPPSWILPARHTLGAAYLDAGMPREAEAVFRSDLEHLPNNGWALFGLARAQAAQGKKSEAARTEKLFQEAWKGADYEITSPCACLSPPAA